MIKTVVIMTANGTRDLSDALRRRCLYSFLDYPDKDPSVARPPEPEIVGSAKKVVHRSEHILGTALHPDIRVKRSGPKD